MNKTEVGELAEPYRKGLMGSSTMPHKVNPGKSEWLIAIARIVRHNAGVMFECMEVENERDTTMWRTEWVTMPESFCLLSGALEHLHQLHCRAAGASRSACARTSTCCRACCCPSA